MSLNENTIKYVPTSAKTGALISLCIAEQITDIERLGADGIIDSLYNPNKSFVGVITMAPSNIKMVDYIVFIILKIWFQLD